MGDAESRQNKQIILTRLLSGTIRLDDGRSHEDEAHLAGNRPVPVAANASGFGVPAPFESVLKLLSGAAPPVGLLCVGAGLDLAVVRTGRFRVALCCALKLAAMPAIALGLAWTLGLSDGAAKALVTFHALPTAPAAYILARQLGGDALLMAGMLTAQTALAVVTLPLWIAFLGP